jgi:polar amino acid transport system substrate-binding protein
MNTAARRTRLQLHHLLGAGMGLLLAAHTTTASACEKTLRRSPDAISQIRLPSGEITGFRQALITEALARMGCKVKVVEMPWARALVDLESGQLDVLPGAFRTPEREAYALFSSLGEHSVNRLFVLRSQADKWPLQELADLRQQAFRLGVQPRVSYGAAFDQLTRDPQFTQRLVTVPSRQSLWRMLSLGRLDGVLADEVSGPSEFRQLGLGVDIQATDVQVRGDVNFTAFSRKHHDAQFVRRFDAALLAMEQDGTRVAIEKRLAAHSDIGGPGTPVRATPPDRNR